MLKLFSFKDLLHVFFLQFPDNFIGPCTQLVPGIINALCVFYMETVGASDVFARHVRYIMPIVSSYRISA